MKKEKKLIAVSLPYANGEAHIGHIAGGYLPADIYYRFTKLMGEDSIFVSGSDMHGSGVLLSAEKINMDPLEYALKNHENFKKVFEELDIKFDIYSNTHTDIHKQTVNEIFLDLYKSGYITIREEEQPFCEHDNKFIPDRFVEGICPVCGEINVKVGESCDKCDTLILFETIKSPKCKLCRNIPILKKTENFFLELEKFQEQLEQYILSKKNFRKNVKDFSLEYIKEGLLPRSITRDMSYGLSIPIEGFENKIIYVWFEALIGYISATREIKKDWKEYWGNNSKSIFFMGKDNIVFHSIILPAILLASSEKFNLPYEIAANEYLLLEGQKMSKSKNHLLLAKDALEKYGKDNLRFYIAISLPENKDFNFKEKELITIVNTTLSSNIGNYVNRTLTFAYKNFNGLIEKFESTEDTNYINSTFEGIITEFSNFKIKSALSQIIAFSDHANKRFDTLKIWENKDKKNMYILAQYVYALGILLSPIIPESSFKILDILNIDAENKTFKYSPYFGKIKKPYIIFPKIEIKYD